MPESEYGLSDVEFFMLVLESVPNGSHIDLDQSEPDLWISRLHPWSSRSNAASHEADFDILDSGLLTAMRELLHENPHDLDFIHHLSMISPDGKCLVSSMDNFAIVHLAELVQSKLDATR